MLSSDVVEPVSTFQPCVGSVQAPSQDTQPPFKRHHAVHFAGLGIAMAAHDGAQRALCQLRLSPTKLALSFSPVSGVCRPYSPLPFFRGAVQGLPIVA